MSDTWRLIDMRIEEAPTQMAIDEAIAYARTKGETPNTIRLYRWNPSAVSIGYFQSLEKEVDLEACSSLGVDVIRRITGGGAVFHDYNGEITYSLVAPDDDPKIPADILTSYELICGAIVEGLAKIGVDSEFKPVNDIIAGGRKISGNAQTRRHGVVLQHGTVLVDSDIRKMFQVLRVSDAKISDKLIQVVEDRVTNIRRYLGRDVPFDEVREALISGFEQTLDMELVPGELTDYEEELVDEYRERYRSREWVYKR
ncbi:MAG: lipoate--protein ligase family protein [Candidatus Bathyarchaeota archaeon]|nr:MAG: lipoate--protein ligase family protein [Candidatus Bathyarchaeota archaeon]